MVPAKRSSRHILAYVGQSMDPWDIPAKLAVETMQKIWDATGGPAYEITTSSPVYQKVCDKFTTRP